MSDTTLGLLVIGVICAVVLALLFLVNRRKTRTQHTLTEYQRGALFLRGALLTELGPGKHVLVIDRDHIVYGDVRPITFSFERQTVALRDGAFAEYSFYATAEISSFKDALFAARNYADVPYYILRRELRAAIFAMDSRTFASRRSMVEREVWDRVEPYLKPAGFKLKAFQLTDLHLSAPGPASDDHDSKPQIVN